MKNGFYSNSPARLIWEKAFGDEYPEEAKLEEPTQENDKNAGPSIISTKDKPLLDDVFPGDNNEF